MRSKLPVGGDRWQWMIVTGRMRQVMVRRLGKVDQMFVLTMSAYNLTRLRTLGSMRLQTGA